MHRILPFAIPLLFAVLLPGCAVKEGTDTPRSANVLTAAELVDAPVTTAYQAIQRYRAHWLHRRSGRTTRNPAPSLPVVYVDGMRRGNVTELQTMRVEDVQRMEYLDPTDATNRFGTNHTGGAILVTTR